jgi:hypothetical protein
LRDDIKAKLDTAMNTHSQQKDDVAARRRAAEEAEELNRLAFKRLCDGVIEPVMQEFKVRLTAAGHVAHVTVNLNGQNYEDTFQEDSITLAVTPSNLQRKDYMGGQAPCISFKYHRHKWPSAPPEKPSINVTVVTRNSSGPARRWKRLC